MHARSSTLMVSPSRIDDGIALVRDRVMPQFLDVDGCLGLSMIVDRASGQCIVTTAWRDEAAMRASALTADAAREEAARLVEGEVTGVQEWEIAVMHRTRPTGEGACVRSTWTRSDPANADHAIEVYRMGVLPRVEGLEGFCSASLLVDRATGLGVSSVAFESRAAMENTRAAAEEMRTRSVAEIGADIIDVREYELALAHLHMPEMA